MRERAQWTREHLQRLRGAAWWMHDTVAHAVEHNTAFTLLDHGAEAAHLLGYALGTYWRAAVQAGFDVGLPVPPEPQEARLLRDVAAHLDEYARGIGSHQPGGRRRTMLGPGGCYLTFANTDPQDAPDVVLRIVPIPDDDVDLQPAEWALVGVSMPGFVEVDVTAALRTLQGPSSNVLQRLSVEEVGDGW